METISHLNLMVEGFPFTKIISLVITHEPNRHGLAEIVGEIPADAEKDTLGRLDESTMVAIKTGAEGQPVILFHGCVLGASLQQDNAYSRVVLKLSSTSRLIDITKKNKTYQNTTLTHSRILEKNIQDKADLHMMVSDRAIGSLLMQYGETDWEFALRMAARLGAPLITNLSSVRPQIYLGMPPSGRTISEDSLFFTSSGETAGGATGGDFMTRKVQSYAYGYLGDTLSFNGSSYRIKTVRASLTDGILQMEYGLMVAGAAGSSGGSGHGGTGNSTGGAGSIAEDMGDGFGGAGNNGLGGGGTGGGGGSAPGATGSPSAGGSSLAPSDTGNTQACGKMMKGTVQAVSGDRVQVFLHSVDQEYDAGGTWWFPYSTAYSSSDGSGWYCMPEVGDEVLVFFPSGNEGEAFAASSVCASPPSNPRNKSWKAPGGKEILLTDEGMYIIGKGGKIYINLTDEKGIEIHSDKDITISSEANVKINSSREVNIVAKNQVVIGTEDAYLDITKDSATLAAAQVLIN